MLYSVCMHACIFACAFTSLSFLFLSLSSWMVTCFLCVFVGILLAVWRSQFLPAGSSTGRAGALEVRAGMWECVFGVWVCRDSCGPRAWWEDQCERPPYRDRWGVSWGQRHHVQFPERHLEPGLHTHHLLPAQRLLPPKLCPGKKHTLGSDFKVFNASVCKGSHSSGWTVFTGSGLVSAFLAPLSQYFVQPEQH